MTIPKSDFATDQRLVALAAKPLAGVDEAIEWTPNLIGDLFDVDLAMSHRDLDRGGPPGPRVGPLVDA